MYNKEEEKFFCLFDILNREGVKNYYNKQGVKCQWVREVKTTF
jgi:hypothetical protein